MNRAYGSGGGCPAVTPLILGLCHFPSARTPAGFDECCVQIHIWYDQYIRVPNVFLMCSWCVPDVFWCVPNLFLIYFKYTYDIDQYSHMFTHTLYAPYTHTHTHTSGFAELCHVCMHACIYPREREREREREMVCTWAAGRGQKTPAWIGGFGGVGVLEEWGFSYRSSSFSSDTHSQTSAYRDFADLPGHWLWRIYASCRTQETQR